MNSPSEIHLDSAMRKIMADRDLRILMFQIIADECRVFDTSVPHNAGAYSLLAVQRIGKLLMANMKSVSPEGFLLAEKEYNELAERQAAFVNKSEGETYDG